MTEIISNPSPKTNKKIMPRMPILILFFLVLLGALGYIYYFQPSFLSNKFKTKTDKTVVVNNSSENQTASGLTVAGGGLAGNQSAESLNLLDSFQNKLKEFNSELKTLKDQTSLDYLKKKLDISDISGDLEISDNLIVNSTSKMEDIIPKSDDNYDLGSSSKGWDNAYIHSLHGSSILTIGDGITSHSLTNTDDLLVSGDMEVNGNTFLDGNTTFGGIIDAGSNLISNLLDPVSDQDAATKNYVDDQTAGITIDLSGKENTITAGTSGQYYRGDKTWASLDTNAISGLGTLATQNANNVSITGGLLSSISSLNGITSTTLGYLDGVSSGIQSQFSGKQNTLSAASGSSDGYLTSADWTTFNGKQNLIATGTSSQYYRGDKTWQTLDQSVISGLTALDSPTFAGATFSGGVDDAEIDGQIVFNDAVGFLGGVDIAGGLGLGVTDINATGDVSVSTDSATAFKITNNSNASYLTTNTTGTAESATVFENPVAYLGGETASVHTTINGAIPNGSIIKNSRYRLAFGTASSNASGTSGTITSLANTILFQNTNNLALSNLYGVTVRPGNPTGSGAGNVTMADYASFVSGHSGSGAGQFNATNYYGFLAEDADTNYGGDGPLPGTQTNVTGVWIAKQTTGDTNNYGLVLDGNGAGADIVLGDAQQNKISRNAITGDFDFTGGGISALSSSDYMGYMGASSQYDLLVAKMKLFIPDIYVAWLNAETTPVTEVDLSSNGYSLALSNIASTDLSTYGANRILTATGDNEYATRADSGTTLSYIDSPMSIEGWIYVEAGSATQTIVSKFETYGGNGREYSLTLNSSETLNLNLSDNLNQASCARISANAITDGWHHIAVVYGGQQGSDANDDIFMYIDGAAISLAAAGACTDFVEMADTQAAFVIGAQNINTFPWQGKLGAISVTANELSATTVSTIYNLTKEFYGQ